MPNTIIRGNQNTTKLITELKKNPDKYKVLSKEDEERLIADYRNDREKLNDELFKHNVRLVFNIAKNYMSKTDDFDSMVQDGMLGLAIAVHNFDIDRGVKFITYATPWILKKIRERYYNKSYEVIKRSVSLNSNVSSSSKINDNDDNELEGYVNDMIDPSYKTLPSVSNQLSTHEQTTICKDLYKMLEDDTSLSATQKQIFIDLYYNKERSKDIQRRYNVTSKDIATIKSYMLPKMRETLSEKYGVTSFLDLYEA